MKIGILADTHDHIENTSYFLNQFITEDVQLIIFAGDLVSPFAVEPFIKTRIPVKGIFGNNEGEKDLIQHKFREVGFEISKAPVSINIEGKKIIVFHTLLDTFTDKIPADIIISAHTHKREVRNEGNCLFINPGEVCGWITSEASALILSLPEGELKWLIKET
ncbi:MAG: metallophosphoesterase [bacterium]